jgi:hypothetical protein
MFKIDNCGLVYYSDVISVCGDLSLNTNLSIDGSSIIHNIGAPIVNIINTDRLKISDEPGMDRMNVTFRFVNYPVENWTVNLNGTSFDTGIVIQSGLSSNGDQNITVEVDYTELSTEGLNRINIYGRSASFDKSWSEYNQP